MRSIRWGGIDLNSADGVYRVLETDVFSSPEVRMDMLDLTRNDGRVMLYESLGGRTINMKVGVSALDQSSADSALDNLKSAVYYPGGRLGQLLVSFPEGDRLFTGKGTNTIVSRDAQDISDATISFQIVTEKSYSESTLGYLDFGAQTVITTSSSAIPVQNNGTYLALPTVVITFSSLPVTSAQFTIGNPDTSQYLTFSATGLTTSSTLTIEIQANRVLVDNRLVRSYGSMPKWMKGYGILEYSDNIGAPHTVTITPRYIPRYI